MVGWMRLALAASAFMSRFVDSALGMPAAPITWLVFFGYVLYSMALFGLGIHTHWFARSRMTCWLDLIWVSAMVVCAGGSSSYLFPFLFFVILTASFRWGFEMGIRIVLATAAMHALTALIHPVASEILSDLLRVTFLLSLGYMIAYWGGSEMTHKRRLAMLRDVSDLSNPRFGADHTIVSVLEKTAAFYNAPRCVLITRDHGSSKWSLRTTNRSAGRCSNTQEDIANIVATQLMALPPAHKVLYTQPLLPFLHAFCGKRACLDFNDATGLWENGDTDAAERLAALLETRSFISAPLSLRKGEGRLFVTAAVVPGAEFRKSDVLFLGDIAAQAFPVIETIQLLDRLASDAGERERERIGRDLHDSAVQPYIGLKHGISAVRNKAAADNPLCGDLDRLVAMATDVIADLRRFASALKSPAQARTPLFQKALQRQAVHMREFYGIDVSIEVAGTCNMNDRLAGELFQIVNEGIANICKHTDATTCAVTIATVERNLIVRIDNDRAGRSEPVPVFTPRSISERVAALGGTAHVACVPERTEIHVAIPV